jgi:NADH:ubiquinone oxidoreductase subunit H
VGPRVVGLKGLLQTIVDRRKLFTKKFFGVLIVRAAFFTINFTSVYLDLYFLLLALGVSSMAIVAISFLNSNSLSYYSVFRVNIISISFDVLFSFLVISFLFFSIRTFLAPLYLLLALMECRRTPYDLNEGESELVSRYNIEYSGLGFTFLFLREYLRLIILNFSLILVSLLFFEWHLFLSFLVVIICIRAILPRFKFFGVLRIVLGPLNLLVFVLLLV